MPFIKREVGQPWDTTRTIMYNHITLYIAGRCKVTVSHDLRYSGCLVYQRAMAIFPLGARHIHFTRTKIKQRHLPPDTVAIWKLSPPERQRKKQTA